jgi:CHAT domain
MWLEIELDSAGEEVRVSARGSRGERPPAHAFDPALGMDAVTSFSNKVGRAVRGGKALDPEVVKAAQALHEEVVKGELRDVLVRLGEASKDRLLVRLFLRDRALQGVPWEALCKPGTTEGFLGTDPKILIARGVASSDPWEPREVRGAIRVLAIAPGSDARALTALQEALAPSIESGEIEWLDPIAGADVSAKVLYDKLRRGKTPHVVHWLGHGGVDGAGRPTLRMADDEDGEEVWLPAEKLAGELSASFMDELRLVVLEACEGAKAGALGSAAEILAKAGADAVVAHLWPVKTDVARTCSTEIYRSLTGADRSSGDIGASVAAARRTLIAGSAEAFSPILFLRGSDSVIFDFAGRRVSKPGAKKKGKALAPAFQTLLDKPFCMVLGELEDDRAVLQHQLEQFMTENGEALVEGQALSTLTQRCVLKFGQDVLHSLFQDALASLSQAGAPPLVDALARFVTPGVHLTLLWRPYLERAIAAKHPDKTLYAIQPSIVSASGKPRVVKRTAGSTVWKMEPVLPRRFDLEQEIVILRLYGGYSAEARPIFSPPILTEDDHMLGALGIEGNQPPGWMQELLARPRIQPCLFLGLSVQDWRHRLLLQWLFDKRPAPQGSLAILPLGAAADEAATWDSGGGLPGSGRIAAIQEDFAQLAPVLEAYTPGGAT